LGGGRSGFGTSIGNNNIAIGLNAHFGNWIGYDNVVIGRNAAYSAQKPAACVVIGNLALDAATTTELNGLVCIGSNAMGDAVVAAGGGVVIGNSAGGDMTSADNCTFVGKLTASTHVSGSNTCAFGYNATPSTTSVANQVTLGDTNISTARIQVDWTILSDERDKKNIRTLEAGLDFINALRPVSYNSDPRSAYYHEIDIREDDVYVGAEIVKDTPDGSKMHTHRTSSFIAQEVLEAIEDHGGVDQEALGDLVLIDDPDKLELQRTGLIVPLVKAVQQLSAKVTAMQEQLDAL
jgi:hypothetical protein